MCLSTSIEGPIHLLVHTRNFYDILNHVTQYYHCHLTNQDSEYTTLYTFHFRPCNLILFWQDFATAKAENSKIIKLQKCCFSLTTSCKWKHSKHSQNWMSYYEWLILQECRFTYVCACMHSHAFARMHISTDICSYT